jgi:hypothetical protein
MLRTLAKPDNDLTYGEATRHCLVDLITGAMAIEQDRIVRPDGRTPAPLGRVLTSDGSSFHRREEAGPRMGVCVVREPMRSRWTLGITHVWFARRKLVGRGKGSSGLRPHVGELSEQTQ